MSGVDEAAAAIRDGKMVVVYDGDEREGEADLVFHAQYADAGRIELLRKEAGGLICLALDKRLAKALELPFYTNLLEASGFPISKMECTKTAYGDKPAFAIPINSKQVYTGITDDDRSLTIRSIAALANSGLSAQKMRERFFSDFYSPGHIFLLIGRGIEKRRGHTELSLELARRANLSGAMVLCEMLGSGRALPKAMAKEYAAQRGIPFIEGHEIAGQAGLEKG